MKHYQYIIFAFCHLVLGDYNISTPILKGRTKMFPLPKLPLGSSINSIEWRYHTINTTILLAKTDLNKKQSKNFGIRTQIMENGELHIKDIKDEDSGNYSCTIILHDHTMHTKWFYLEVLKADVLNTEPSHPVNTTTSDDIKPSEPSIPDAALIAIPVCAAFTILLMVATILICKCRKKCCCTSEEPIYANSTAVHKSSKQNIAGGKMDG